MAKRMLDRMKFSGQWREYQARAIGEMDNHLGDNRLHVVAAPGAGKTVLGLEIMRRLGRRALVFAPSLAIRDQWRERLCPLFLPELPSDDDVSCDLSDPRVMTLSTYQSLDSFRRDDDLTSLIESLNQRGPFTLILDEAHHLRKAWWDCLTRLAVELDDATIVALTATPPYDASRAEWNRYETLCGPIDLEIGIPELVRNGDLCPHQDHVVLSLPTAQAQELLDVRRKAIAELQADLRSDTDLLDWLGQHEWLQAPDTHIETILEAPEMLSAVLIHLASSGRELPDAPLKLLGVSRKVLPLPSEVWLETLLDGLVFRHANAFALPRDWHRALKKRLQQNGLIEGKRVQLRHTKSVFRLLASSLGKMASVVDIAKAESASHGSDLRMVVLSDHIRADELPKSADAPFEPAKLGVIPIFESLRRAGAADDRLAVLTGSLVMIPKAAEPILSELCDRLGIKAGTLRTKAVKACPDHVELQITGGSSADLTRIVTALFTSGQVRILVGTQSLLGQGWDAPALNSLVLASNTASFVLSNQMRGRAIRINPAAPDKVSNIWHLATIERGDDSFLEALTSALDWGALNDNERAGTTDIGTVARRFRAFECISNGQSDIIENGLGRLGLNPRLSVAAQNRATFALASDREQTASRWERSLGHGLERSQVRETAAPNYAPRALSWGDTLQSLGWSAMGSAGVAAGLQLTQWTSFAMGAVVFTGVAGAATMASLPALWRAGRLAWRNGSLERSLEQVTGVVIEALLQVGQIPEDEADAARIMIGESLDGRMDITVSGVARASERHIMQAIAELLGPVQNPRYLLVRASRLNLFSRTDYHAVPTALGARKEDAEIFVALWRKRVGSSQLVFTRNKEGRGWLIKARMRSFAAGFQRSVDRRSAWL
ncbi:MAG: DEAD/DEAH box helicase family protein [Pseudomonadota bacterium]